jgi:glycosyltransferase involved in cell wall biosynthesis
LRTHFVNAGFPESKLVALVNGVDTTRFSPGERLAARQALSIPPESLVLVMVGRLIASKQHKLLFQALEDVVESFPQLMLLVVGDGGRDQASVREAARASKVAHHIRMEGFIPDPVTHYRAADLLVAPSEVEGLSNVVLEAMACGLPSLLHDACGNRDVIDHGVDGVVTPLDTVAKLAEAIKNLLANPGQLHAYGLRARDKVEAQFTLQQMARAYEGIYRELATGRY